MNKLLTIILNFAYITCQICCSHEVHPCKAGIVWSEVYPGEISFSLLNYVVFIYAFYKMICFGLHFETFSKTKQNNII